MSKLVDRQFKQYDKLSRYSSFPIYYNTEDGKYVYGTTAYLRDDTPFLLHTVRLGDTYDSIALKYYNNPTKFWIICDFNRVLDTLKNPRVGDVLKIPVMSNIEYDI